MGGKLTIVASDAMECVAGRGVLRRESGLITGRIEHDAALRPVFQATLCPKSHQLNGFIRRAA
jgi:hypothetical protein